MEQLRHIIGEDGAQLLDLAIRNAHGTSTGLVGSIVGFVTLFLAASGVFGEMEDALNVIWRAPRLDGLSPDEHILMMLDRGVDEIYALDVEYR